MFGNGYHQSWLSLAGFMILVAYTVSSLLIEPIESYASSLLILLGFGGVFAMGQKLRFSAPLWMLLGALIIALLSWGLAHVHHPDWAETSPKVHRLTIWFQFIAVAWLLGGKTHRTFVIWGLYTLSLLFAPWVTGGGMKEWLLGFQGKRIDFGINNAQHTAMLYSIVFLGLIAFSQRFLKPGKARIQRAFLWIAGLLIFGGVTIMTQTRSVWLGCIVAGLVFIVALVIWLARMQSSRARSKVIIIAITAVTATITLAAFTLSDIVEHRLNAETEVIEGLLSESTTGSKLSSISYRIASWEAAIPWIQERPLIGWGGNGRKLVLDHSKHLPSWIKPNTQHLHSSYMDTLVNFGLLGLILLLTILVWTALLGTKAWKRGFMPGDMLIFYLAFIMFWLVVNIFESFMFYSTGQYAFGLVVGGIVTHIWRMQVSETEEKQKLTLKSQITPDNPS